MGIQIGEDITEKTILRDAKFWILWIRTKKQDQRISEWQFQKQRLMQYRGEEYVTVLVKKMNEIKYGYI